MKRTSGERKGITYTDMAVPNDRASSGFSPLHHDAEEARLASVRETASFCWLGENREDGPMKSIARQAAAACDTSVAMVSLMEEHEQRFMACVGRGRESTDRENTFCAYCILQAEPMVVEDATDDVRFQNNPYVLGEPRIRFYLGVPILDGGLPLGTVCVVDTRPREASSKCVLAMERLAEKAAAVLRLRKYLGDRHGPFAPQGKLRQSIEELDSILLPLVER